MILVTFTQKIVFPRPCRSNAIVSVLMRQALTGAVDVNKHEAWGRNAHTSEQFSICTSIS